MTALSPAALLPRLGRVSALLGIALALALVSSGSMAAPPARAAAGFTLGFADDDALTYDPAPVRAVWDPRAVKEGASFIRLGFAWSDVAPKQRPAGFNPTNPASPAYNWSGVDAAVRDANAHGLKVLMMIFGAPTWAEGPHRPGNLPEGVWEPNAQEFGQFATAAARRYSGTFPDPKHPGSFLPRVSYWQGWNEPNLGYYLSPQWTQTSHGYVPASPSIYRGLENAFYGAVKAVNPSNFVVNAGTAPYGDPPGNARMAPMVFYRNLFCLSRSLHSVSCPGPIYLDAVDHHPYEISAPTVHAHGPDNVTVPDVYKVRDAVAAGVKAGHILPNKSKPLWIDELAWDTNPPSTSSIAHSLSTQAKWCEQAMYLLWRQGARMIMWLQLRDMPSSPGFLYAFHWSGMYSYGGKAKPSAITVKFPFVTTRRNHNQIRAWGRVPRGGELKISRRLRSGKWSVVKRMKVTTHEVFWITLGLRGQGTLRAQVGGNRSLPWSQSA